MANELSASQREMVREFGKMTFLEEQSKFDESFQLAVALEEKYRGQPNVAYAFGLSLVARSEAEKALPYFQQELSHNPRHVQSLLQLAFQLILLSRFEESIQYSQRATGVEPDNFAGYYALGQGYLYLNNLPSAILNLEKATTLEPDSSSAFYTLWQAYQRANRPADAARARAEFERLDELAKKMRGEAIAGAPPSTPEPPASPAP
jgi:tetratricopeptide (TPR) repeat protein